jgi:energy-coupling factor transporter ATP-binding protein EcfA2
VRIKHLAIANLRAIARLELIDLEDMVLIAGPNGCGKSCIFDAVRLLKSCYGGYQPNEWHQWFGEFQINISRSSVDLSHWLFRDRSKSVTVGATFELSPSEIAYIRDNLGDIATDIAWQIEAPHTQGFGVRPVARDLRSYGPRVAQRVEQITEEVLAELARDEHVAEITIGTNSDIHSVPNPLLELVFATYDPKHIGIIDYHSANRAYGREQVGGINLNIESKREQTRQTALYNTPNKYGSIKSEMASTYVRDLIARQRGRVTDDSQSLTRTLQELFQSFFPDKSFSGPLATEEGGFDFPVTMSDGAEHDINDLSSGEKELLFGYLRLRNSSPRHSVILLDEPELHLNPALIRGLPQFYRKHIGQALGNQIWLVTHSDAFLREATGEPGFSVFHMQRAVRTAGELESPNQVTPVNASSELELAVIDLVGDLATYHPDATVVIFEGDDAEFDCRMTSKLFPELTEKANLISAGSKSNARRLHELLERAVVSGGIAARFFSIVDRDSDRSMSEDGLPTHFRWPAYHIENFLLQPKYILRALREISETERVFADEDAVYDALKDAARQTLPDLLRHRMQNDANDLLLAAMELRPDQRASNVAASLAAAAHFAMERFSKVVRESLTEAILKEKEELLACQLQGSLESDGWRNEFRGREVLKRFVGDLGSGINYRTLRDLVISRMADDGFRPEGMKAIVDSILRNSTGVHRTR